jgi:hypothetical protein
LLGHAGDVEHAVDPAVAAEVEAMPDWRAVALTGGQSDGAGAAPAGELRFAGEPERVSDLAEQGGCGDWSDPGLVTQGGAVRVEEVVQIAFELADLPAGSAVLVDERQEPREPVGAGLGRHDRDVDGVELAEPDSILPVVGSWSRISLGSLASWSWA